MSTIHELVEHHFTDPNEPGPEVLEAALLAREEQIRDNLAFIAAQLGTFPELVAFAFVQAGLGPVPTPEVRAMMQAQAEQRMAWLQEQIRRQQEGGQG